jgi:hypothetical protein
MSRKNGIESALRKTVLSYGEDLYLLHVISATSIIKLLDRLCQVFLDVFFILVYHICKNGYRYFKIDFICLLALRVLHLQKLLKKIRSISVGKLCARSFYSSVKCCLMRGPPAAWRERGEDAGTPRAPAKGCRPLHSRFFTSYLNGERGLFFCQMLFDAWAACGVEGERRGCGDTRVAVADTPRPGKGLPPSALPLLYLSRFKRQQRRGHVCHYCCHPAPWQRAAALCIPASGRYWKALDFSCYPFSKRAIVV